MGDAKSAASHPRTECTRSCSLRCGTVAPKGISLLFLQNRSVAAVGAQGAPGPNCLGSELTGEVEPSRRVTARARRRSLPGGRRSLRLIGPGRPGDLDRRCRHLLHRSGSANSTNLPSHSQGHDGSYSASQRSEHDQSETVPTLSACGQHTTCAQLWPIADNWLQSVRRNS
jgi:hypothetical protein